MIRFHFLLWKHAPLKRPSAWLLIVPLFCFSPPFRLVLGFFGFPLSTCTLFQVSALNPDVVTSGHPAAYQITSALLFPSLSINSILQYRLNVKHFMKNN
jgi:hypothetical protein